MREKSFALWKEKLDWIAQNGGMAHLKTHPDYMSFDAGALGTEEYPISYYADFLRYVKRTYADQYWHVCPSELADYYFDHADENPWQQTHAETLCQACRSALENNRVLVFGASHNGN
jgi:hypothetical protein